ncbi:MAG: hypothetical protein U0Q15_21110 [Kineosporiaceae bacterium]
MAETRSGATPASGVLASADSSPTVLRRADGSLDVRPSGEDGVSVAGRSVAPFRRPRPSRAELGYFGLWVLGLVLALFVPALVVGPTQTDAPAGRVWGAFAITVAGALVMIGAAMLMWRRSKDSTVLVFGGVPAVACIAGGVILVATKLTVVTQG